MRAVLEPIGAVRLRPLHLPEAGGSFELWAVVSFIGLAYVGGFVEHIGEPTYRAISEAFLRFWREKRERDGTEPEMSLLLSWDDLDLRIGPVDERDLERMPALGDAIRRHLQAEPLRSTSVTKIVLGMVRVGGEWHEPHLWNRADDGGRFWGVSLETHRAITHIYDSENNLLAPMPRGESPEAGIG